MTAPDGLELIEGRQGLRAIPRAPWRSEFSEYLYARPVAEVELNQGKGWSGRDVDFLRSFPQLRGLEILHLRIDDIDGIHSLHHLTELVLGTYCRTGLRFSEFPSLERCSLDWGKRHVTGLLDSVGLRHLSISHFPRHDLSELSRLTRLESLWIYTSPVASLRGIEALRSLRGLHLRGLRRLVDLHGIQSLAALEELEFDTCRRVRSIEAVRSLARLRKVYFNNCGELDSIAPLEPLQALEEVLFFESTNVVDGDLAPLTCLPRLRNLSFQNRRHYSHRREQFRAYTDARRE